MEKKKWRANGVSNEKKNQYKSNIDVILVKTHFDFQLRTLGTTTMANVGVDAENHDLFHIASISDDLIEISCANSDSVAKVKHQLSRKTKKPFEWLTIAHNKTELSAHNNPRSRIAKRRNTASGIVFGRCHTIGTKVNPIQN